MLLWKDTMANATYKIKWLIWVSGFKGLESVMVEQRYSGRNRWELASWSKWRRQRKSERNWGWSKYFETSKPASSDIPSHIRPYPLILSKQFHPLRTKYSNTWMGVYEFIYLNIWIQVSMGVTLLKLPHSTFCFPQTHGNIIRQNEVNVTSKVPIDFHSLNIV